MNADQIKHMVDRFLMWPLPRNFTPDNGISYKRPNYAPNVPGPSGTNLLDATQAAAMVRHMVDGLPTVNSHAPLTAALEEARGKVDELEALREQQAAAFVKFAEDRPVAPHPVDQMENLRRAMTTDIEIEKLEAERDSLRSKLAEAERERDEARRQIDDLCDRGPRHER
jgi:hypothetical protein